MLITQLKAKKLSYHWQPERKFLSSTAMDAKKFVFRKKRLLHFRRSFPLKEM